MTGRIKFYLDEHVPNAVARALVRLGVDVVTAGEAKRLGLRDSDQLEFASREGRVMVTMDSDYIALAGQGTPHAGVAYAQPGKRSIGELVDGLFLIYDVFTPDQMIGNVEYL